jgi:hypothetical protein
MEATLENKILRAKELARSRDADGAAQLADELIAAHPGEMRVWLLRGYLHEHRRSDSCNRARLT